MKKMLSGVLGLSFLLPVLVSATVSAEYSGDRPTLPIVTQPVFLTTPATDDAYQIICDSQSTLSMGSRGQTVRALQTFLLGQNSQPLFDSATGYFGNLTRLSLWRYQKANSLPLSGRLDSYTRANICHPPQASQNFSIVSFKGPTQLRKGQFGVWQIQMSDPTNYKLTYSINWGDGFTTNSVFNAPANFYFGHSYVRAGTYQITATVIADNGLRCFKAPCPNTEITKSTSIVSVLP